MARVEATAPSGGRPAAELARRIARSRLGRLPYLGDVYESGTAREFEVNFGGVYGSLARRMVPTPGHHDWAKRGEGYFPYWRGSSGGPCRATVRTASAAGRSSR